MKEGLCPKCGGRKVIPGIPILDLGHHNKMHSLSALIIERSDLFFDDASTFPLKAWICGSCGYAEIYVDDPQGLSESYQRFLDLKKERDL